MGIVTLDNLCFEFLRLYTSRDLIRFDNTDDMYNRIIDRAFHPRMEPYKGGFYDWMLTQPLFLTLSDTIHIFHYISDYHIKVGIENGIVYSDYELTRISLDSEYTSDQTIRMYAIALMYSNRKKATRCIDRAIRKLTETRDALYANLIYRSSTDDEFEEWVNAHSLTRLVKAGDHTNINPPVLVRCTARDVSLFTYVKQCVQAQIGIEDIELMFESRVKLRRSKRLKKSR